MNAEEKEVAAKATAKGMLDESYKAWEDAGSVGPWTVDLALIAEATGLSQNVVKGLKGHMTPPKPSGTPAAKPAAQPAPQPEPAVVVLEDGTVKKPTPAQAEKPAPGSIVDKLELHTDAAQGLRAILKITSGAPGPQVAGVLQAVEDEPERYTNNGMELYSSLQLAGLSNQRAQIATTKWLNRVGSQKEALHFSDQTRLLAGGELAVGAEDPITKTNRMVRDMMAQQIEMMQLSIQRDQLAAMQRSGARGPSDEDDNKTRLDKMMDRMEEIKIITSVFKDSSGTGPVNGSDVAYEEHTEYEDQKDAGTGQVLRVPVRTVKTPILLTRMEHGAGQSGSSQILGRMTDAYMIKMMADAMKGTGGGMYMPGTVIEMVPKMENGKVVMDEASQPVMIQRTSYNAPGAAAPAAGTFTPKDAVDMTIKMAEVFKPQKSESDATMTQFFMKQATDAQAAIAKMYTDQINSMSEYDPVGQSVDTLKQLQTLGLAGGGEVSEKAALMGLELKKWQIDESNKMQRWLAEQRDIKDGRKESRQQMAEVTQTLRTAIKDIGGPLAQNFGEGLKSGMANRAAQPQQAPQQRGTPPADLGDLTDTELAAELTKAAQVKRVVSDASVRLIEEARKRGLDPAHVGQQQVAPTVSEVGEQEVGGP